MQIFDGKRLNFKVAREYKKVHEGLEINRGSKDLAKELRTYVSNNNSR